MTFVVPFSEPTPMHQVEDLTEDLVATQEELSSQQLAQQKDHQQRQAKKNRLFVWKSLKLKSEAFSIPKGLFPGFQLLLWSCLGDFTSLFLEGENSDGCTGVPVLVATWESLAFLFFIFIFPWCCLVRRNGGSWSVELLCCIADRPRRKNGNGSCTKSARNVKNLQLFVPRAESHD